MKKSSREVLKMLRDAGRRGVSTGEFTRAGHPRAAARMFELRRLGFEIETEQAARNAYRFTLISEPAAAPEQFPPDEPDDADIIPDPAPAAEVQKLPEGEDGTEPLFDLEPVRHHDPESEWVA